MHAAFENTLKSLSLKLILKNLNSPYLLLFSTEGEKKKKKTSGHAFPFNIMEMGKGLNRRKILLPETLDILLRTFLKERIC